MPRMGRSATRGLKSWTEQVHLQPILGTKNVERFNTVQTTQLLRCPGTGCCWLLLAVQLLLLVGRVPAYGIWGHSHKAAALKDEQAVSNSNSSMSLITLVIQVGITTMHADGTMQIDGSSQLQCATVLMGQCR